MIKPLFMAMIVSASLLPLAAPVSAVVPPAATHPSPYWASLAAGAARMRVGPGRNYPSIWLYQRAGLPMRVIESYPGWRKVRDPDGVEGWMIGNLLTSQRTAIVRVALATLHPLPRDGSQASAHAEQGVVGRVSQCADGWCRFDIAGVSGFVHTTDLWGVDAAEKLD